MVMLLLAQESESPKVAIEVGPDLPCTPAELLAAVALRLPLAAEGRSVRVAIAGLDAVEIEGLGRRRLLPLYGARGPAAARKIALFITDLARAELEVEPLPMPEPTATPTTAAVATAITSTPTPPAIAIEVAAEPSRRWAIGGFAGGGGGTNLDRPTLTIGAEASWELLPAFSLIGSGAFAWMPSGRASGVEVSYWAIATRAGLGVDLGLLEARAQALLEPHHVATDDGTPGQLGLIFGLTFGAARRQAITEHLSLVFLAGFDLRLNRREFQVAGEPALSTERGLFWLAIGVSWGQAR